MAKEWANIMTRDVDLKRALVDVSCTSLHIISTTKRKKIQN